MTATPTAAEIIARTNELYAACATYEDEGECTRVMIGPDLPNGRHEGRQPFRTSFVRPSKLFFEYEYSFFSPAGPWYRSGVCANESGVTTWKTIDSSSDSDRTLSVAISGLTGVSGGTAHDVPRLLLPSVIGGRQTLPEAGLTTLTGEREQDGRPCFVLEGRHCPGARLITIWIDRESLLLRRAEYQMDFNAESRQEALDRTKKLVASMPDGPRRDKIAATLGIIKGGSDFAAESTTIWRPRIDEKIDPAVFEFRPPEATN